ncbi:4-hydroxybenzoate octaprenyltransferase [Candidatus Glomeribacter gigasporarum]|uniref:4-hydroxybenzoate octaprenyltransferase n=1 Tax=Candidatus Glomeribacter gigasporarum TaxID=132144 RepID=UPI00030D23F0|nr:4-hydroxybenzoate octaprenyltransferase [Candidatus Glomeribacter gigasporarum]
MRHSTFWSRCTLYLQLIRFDKPVGSLLLLWPTLSALWIASDGRPPLTLLLIFIAGTVLMRSAGCALNDYADRHFDRHVQRTCARPLASGKLAPRQALVCAAALALIAFTLLLQLNALTRALSFAALFLAVSYPYTKRFFALPQAYLGIAFGFGIPMAFAAVQNQVPLVAWAMLAANMYWTMAYDTEYAIADREDDLNIGIRTSAMTFGADDVRAVMISYALFLTIYAVFGIALHFLWPFWLGWIGAGACAIYHCTLIRARDARRCLAAFRHNSWLGAILFGGIAAQFLV